MYRKHKSKVRVSTAAAKMPTARSSSVSPHTQGPRHANGVSTAEECTPQQQDPPHSKSRTLVQECLQIHDDFRSTVARYQTATGQSVAFFQNRIACSTSAQFWELVDIARQCRSCGAMLVSHPTDGGTGSVPTKLLCCGRCKSVHYCNRECQVHDWKNGHKETCPEACAQKKTADVVQICVRALTLMTFVADPRHGSEIQYTKVDAAVVNDLFSFADKDQPIQATGPYFSTRVDLSDNLVSRHFHACREARRILIPMWDAATDNLVFVPVCLDFLSRGMRLPELACELADSLAQPHRRYILLVMSRMKGLLGHASASTWISTQKSRLGPQLAHAGDRLQL